jgi:hypothetical protein
MIMNAVLYKVSSCDAAVELADVFEKFVQMDSWLIISSCSYLCFDS